ncbi:MAG: dihydrodipicolinate synthase family protein, partial [Halanaerobiales bacterium]
RRFSYDYWSKICELENLIGIKCAAFDRYQTLDVVRAAALSSRADEIALYTGNDNSIIIDLLTKFSFKKDKKIYKKEFVGGLL